MWQVSPVAWRSQVGLTGHAPRPRCASLKKLRKQTDCRFIFLFCFLLKPRHWTQSRNVHQRSRGCGSEPTAVLQVRTRTRIWVCGAQRRLLWSNSGVWLQLWGASDPNTSFCSSLFKSALIWFYLIEEQQSFALSFVFQVECVTENLFLFVKGQTDKFSCFLV